MSETKLLKYETACRERFSEGGGETEETPALWRPRATLVPAGVARLMTVASETLLWPAAGACVRTWPRAVATMKLFLAISRLTCTWRDP